MTSTGRGSGALCSRAAGTLATSDSLLVSLRPSSERLRSRTLGPALLKPLGSSLSDIALSGQSGIGERLLPRSLRSDRRSPRRAHSHVFSPRSETPARTTEDIHKAHRTTTIMYQPSTLLTTVFYISSRIHWRAHFLIFQPPLRKSLTNVKIGSQPDT